MSYSRGGVLPCSLILEGSDKDALDAFSMPSSIVVVLRRRVRYYHANSSARQGVAWNESFDDVGTAVWWQAPANGANHLMRQMEGEIRLAKDLRPTSAMGHFSLSVCIHYTCLSFSKILIRIVFRCFLSFRFSTFFVRFGSHAIGACRDHDGTRKGSATRGIFSACLRAAFETLF